MLGEMKKLALWAFVLMIVAAVSCQAAMGAADTDKGATTQGGVRVLVEMPRDVPSDKVPGWVFLTREGRPLARQGTRFEGQPVTFEHVELGKAKVVVVPWFGGKLTWGLWGDADVDIPAGRIEEVTVKLRKAETASVVCRILQTDGKPYRDRDVLVYDMAAMSDSACGVRFKTDAKGEFEFAGLVGRQYCVRVRIGFPNDSMASPPCEVKQGSKNVLMWRMMPGRLLTIRFFEQRGGQRLPFKDLKDINVQVVGVSGYNERVPKNWALV